MYWNELSKRLSKKVISKVFTYKLIIDQVNVCRQCIHDFLIVSFDFYVCVCVCVCLCIIKYDFFLFVLCIISDVE